MGATSDPKPPSGALLLPVSAIAPPTDPTKGQEAPASWQRPRLWTPGCLICVCIANVTFDDPDFGRVSLDTSFWRDPLDPTGRYSAMVETY